MTFNLPRSTSFALATSGLAFLLLALCYLLVDVWRLWPGGPFTILGKYFLFINHVLQLIDCSFSNNNHESPGMNSLFLYVGTKTTEDVIPFHFRYGAMDTHFALLMDTCWSVAVWAMIALELHRRRIYVSL